MTMTTARRSSADTTTASPGSGRRIARCAAAGYTLAWVAGLSVFSSSADVRSTGGEVLAGIRGHRAAAITQYALTEGITSVLLVIALVPLWRALRTSRARAVTATATIAAVVVSFTECALGIALVAGSPGAATAGSINDAINRLDGLKMLLLAVAVAAVLGVGRGRVSRPRWLAGLGGATALALVASGLGYVTLDGTLAQAAWVSLPLLIAAVVAAAFAAS